MTTRAPARDATAPVSSVEPLSTTTTSATTAAGTRRTTSPMTAASFRAGMTRHGFAAEPDAVITVSSRSEDTRAGAARLEEVTRVGACPVERHRLASHERAVGVGGLDAARQLTPRRAPPVAGGHERAAATRGRNLAHPGELGGREHPLAPGVRQVLEAEIRSVPVHARHHVAARRDPHGLPTAPRAVREGRAQHGVEDRLAGAHETGLGEQAPEAVPEFLVGEREGIGLDGL